MIKELSNGYYIDSWWDRFTRSWVTQLKDMDGNEIDCSYSGNKEDRDFEIASYEELYKDGIEEIDEAMVKKKKNKKKELPALDTLHPIEVLPDAAGGIDSFNSSFGSGGESSAGVSESLDEDFNRDKYVNQLKKWGKKYNFDRFGNKQLYAIYMKELERQDKLKKKKKKSVDKPVYKDDENDNVAFDGDSFWKDGIEFESEEAAREYFEEELMENKVYLNDLQEAFDMVDTVDKSTKLTESLSESTNKSLRESLKQRDRDDFDNLSECYELEQLFEAIKKDLSKEDIDAIKEYANDSRNSSEEVVAYIEGKLDEEIEDNFFKETEPSLSESYDEEWAECEWCHEPTPEDELVNTGMGKICEYCVQELRSRGEPVSIIYGESTKRRPTRIMDNDLEESLKEDYSSDKFSTNAHTVANEIAKNAEEYGLGVEIHSSKERSDGIYVVSFDIEWGDWKHDHLRFDFLTREFLSENGYELLDTNEIETEEDGSDTYSATHIFMIKKSDEDKEIK